MSVYTQGKRSPASSCAACRSRRPPAPRSCAALTASTRWPSFPGAVTVNPELTDVSFALGDLQLPAPHPGRRHGRRGRPPLRRRLPQDGRSRGPQSGGHPDALRRPRGHSRGDRGRAQESSHLASPEGLLRAHPPRAYRDANTGYQGPGGPVRRILHPRQHQAVRAAGRGGGGRRFRRPVHGDLGPPHLPQPHRPQLRGAGASDAGAGGGGQHRQLRGLQGADGDGRGRAFW